MCRILRPFEVFGTLVCENDCWGIVRIWDVLVEQGGPFLSYERGGADWGGVCESGKRQSPVNLLTKGPRRFSWDGLGGLLSFCLF